VDLRTSPLQLHKNHIDTCATSLTYGELDYIMKYCRYDVIAAPIPSQIFRLDQETIVPSNVTDLYVHCDRHNVSRSILHNVYQIKCGCVVASNDVEIPLTSTYCQDNLTLDLSPQHVINLTYLSHFFESSQLTYLTADILLNSSIPIHLPELKNDSKEYDAKLGIEEQYTFDMEMVINATQQDQTVFGNLAHYLYSVLASSHCRNESFDAMNALDWLPAAATVCGLRFLGTYLGGNSTLQTTHSVIAPDGFQIACSLCRQHYTSVGSSLLPTHHSTTKGGKRFSLSAANS